MGTFDHIEDNEPDANLADPQPQADGGSFWRDTERQPPREYNWPANVTNKAGDVLFMEGNITSDDKPYTVGCLSRGVKPAVWTEDFATFDEARERFQHYADRIG